MDRNDNIGTTEMSGIIPFCAVLFCCGNNCHNYICMFWNMAVFCYYVGALSACEYSNERDFHYKKQKLSYITAFASRNVSAFTYLLRDRNPYWIPENPFLEGAKK